MAELEERYQQKSTFFRNWGAVVILLVFFFASWGGQFVTQLQVEKQNSEQHGEVFTMTEFWPQFFSSTLENWQSEWLQLATQALIVSGFSAYVFRKQDEEHYKTQVMVEQLRNDLLAKGKPAEN